MSVFGHPVCMSNMGYREGKREEKVWEEERSRQRLSELYILKPKNPNLHYTMQEWEKGGSRNLSEKLIEYQTFPNINQII